MNNVRIVKFKNKLENNYSITKLKLEKTNFIKMLNQNISNDKN